MLRCIHYGESVYLNRQCKQFKNAGNEALNNKIYWLSHFINFATLTYQCKACMAKNCNIICPAVTTEVNEAHVSQEISNLKQSIVALNSKISIILPNLGLISCNIVSPVINAIEFLLKILLWKMEVTHVTAVGCYLSQSESAIYTLTIMFNYDTLTTVCLLYYV